MIRLVCGHRGTHRPVTVFACGAVGSPRLRGAALDLNCPHCGFAPRPGDDGLRALLELAATRPGMTLDINPRHQ